MDSHDRLLVLAWLIPLMVIVPVSILLWLDRRGREKEARERRLSAESKA